MKLLLLLLFLIVCSEPTVAHEWCDVSPKCEYHNKLHEDQDLKVLKMCIESAKGSRDETSNCFTFYKNLKSARK